VAVDAVSSEPSSDSNSLLNRELAGNFLDSGLSGAELTSISVDFMSVSEQIPYSKEQGIISEDQGIYGADQVIIDPITDALPTALGIRFLACTRDNVFSTSRGAH
jgi:hypothetical protein